LLLLTTAFAAAMREATWYGLMRLVLVGKYPAGVQGWWALCEWCALCWWGWMSTWGSAAWCQQGARRGVSKLLTSTGIPAELCGIATAS